MKALLAKELREGLKWAALILVGTGIATAIAMQNSLTYWLLDCGCATTVPAAAGGLLLGLMSVVFEARADRWAFLVHRPISRTRIFFSKAAASMILLTLATGIPLAASVAWSLSDRWREPFFLEMALPWIIDLLGGAAYIFAGMAIGLRRVRWYGSKILVLGLPLAASGFTWLVPEMWQGGLVTAAAIAASCLAAWGAFLAWGEYRLQPLPSRAALGVHIFCGICLAAAPAFAIVGALLPHACRIAPEPWTETLFRLDGSILRASHEPDGSVTVTEDGGTRTETFRDEATFQGTYPDSRLASFSGMLLGPPRPVSLGRYGNVGRFYCLVESPENESWYYSIPEGIFRGYDNLEKRPIGTLSPEGFLPAGESPRSRFPGARCYPGLYSRILFPLTGGVYWPVFRERKVETLFTAGPGDEVLGAATLRWGSGTLGRATGTPEDFVVVTRSSFVVLDRSGKVKIRAALPFDPGSALYVQVACLEKPERLLLRAVLVGPGQDGARPTHEPIYEVGTDGKVALKTMEPRLLGRSTRPLSPSQAVAVRMFHAAGGPALALGAWFVELASRERLFIGLVGEDRFSPLSPGEFWALLVAGSIVAAAGAFALARRDAVGPRRGAVWTAAALVFGIPALFALLCLDRRAILVKCPACSKKRPVDRETCPRCRAAFPEPAPAGTEILEGLRASS